VKGQPGKKMVFKLKYERIPQYCTHCGFLGHKKEDCEKRRRGFPSLDYEVYQLRCSPFKKFEHRAHFFPPSGHASAKRGLSFGSFGSVESSRASWQSRTHDHRQDRQQGSSRGRGTTPTGLEDMPPLEEDEPDYGDGPIPVGAHDGFDETEAMAIEEVDQNLLPKIDAMQMGSTPAENCMNSVGTA
jgi:hypothetical protein